MFILDFITHIHYLASNLNKSMKAIILLVFFVMIMTGCATKHMSKDLRKDFTNCFEGKSTNIRSLIDIDGYYIMYDLDILS